MTHYTPNSSSPLSHEDPHDFSYIDDSVGGSSGAPDTGGAPATNQVVGGDKEAGNVLHTKSHVTHDTPNSSLPLSHEDPHYDPDYIDDSVGGSSGAP